MTGSHFRQVQTFDLEFAPIKITQYESTRTGMRVVVASQESPKVYGYFALATEIHDDSGAPHTLEHLCFMGSRSYKYKGLLDRLATRAYSSTNAWTANDHTAYTLETAGWQGFNQILPIYLEHLLLPELTEAGYITEVHHINGQGEDSGVVYSEMQGVQNTQSNLMAMATSRLIYPEGNGFRYETGGMMEPLRSLTLDRIKTFHKEMYQPKNLSLVLVGMVDHTELLRTLDKFESSIIDSVPSLNDPFRRPWVESPDTPSIPKTIIETVEFPEQDEDTGEVSIDFLGPKYADVVASVAIDILLLYLAGGSASVLENQLVEKEQVCSAVYFTTYSRTDLSIGFRLSSVVTDKLADVEQRFFDVLKATASAELDMSYLQSCIQRWKRQVIHDTEVDVDTFATHLIEDHVFGDRSGRDLREMRNFKYLEELEQWKDADWRSFMQKWLSDAPHVSILGKPSKNLYEQLDLDEKKRLEARRKAIGSDGLADLGKKLDHAKDENEKPIPPSVFADFPVPGISSIHFIKTVTARAGLARHMGVHKSAIQDKIDADDANLPLFLHLEHIQTQFIRIKLIMGTGQIPVHLKPLLPLFLDNFFTTAVHRDGQLLDFEAVTKALEQDTVEYSIGPGPGNRDMMQIRFTVQKDKYGAAIAWIRTLMYDHVFTEERLKASLSKLLADIPEEKRSGSSMCSSVFLMTEFSTASADRASDTLVKALYLKRTKKLLATKPEVVIEQLKQIAAIVREKSNLRASVSANIETLDFPVSAWQAFVQDATQPSLPRAVEDPLLSIGDAGKNPGNRAYIVPMATTDSAFARFSVTALQGFDHPDLPACTVAQAYLTVTEGPLWTAVRGGGSAYGAGIVRSAPTGRMSLRIWRASDVVQAFTNSKKEIEDLASGAKPLDDLALEGAISSIIAEMADEQPNAAAAAATSLVNQVILGIDKDWSSKMLEKVRRVTADDVRGALKEYFLRFFDPARANMYIVCPTSQKDALQKAFADEQIGFKADVQPLSFFEDDYGFENAYGEDEEDENEGSEGNEDGSDGGDDGSDEDGDD